MGLKVNVPVRFASAAARMTPQQDQQVISGESGEGPVKNSIEKFNRHH
ncbi:MAG TPA: hypothetical protein VI479_00415 [Blastocatellia bacterium]